MSERVQGGFSNYRAMVGRASTFAGDHTHAIQLFCTASIKKGLEVTECFASSAAMQVDFCMRFEATTLEIFQCVLLHAGPVKEITILAEDSPGGIPIRNWFSTAIRLGRDFFSVRNCLFIRVWYRRRAGDRLAKECAISSTDAGWFRLLLTRHR